MTNNGLETGNSIEKSISPLFKIYFPNYEGYYINYLVPLMKNRNWRRDTHPELERIGISSFGMLKSINFVNNKKDKIRVSSDPEQTFKNIYFHFGLAIDCIEALARSITLVESELEIIYLDNKMKLSNETLLRSFEKWIDEEYENCYQKMITEGKPIFYYPQHSYNFLFNILTDKKIKNSFSKVTKQIKDYRNFFIHNPGVDVFIDTQTKKRYAIKKEMVNKSRNWAELRELYCINKSLFKDPEEMVTIDLKNLLQEFNSIWPSISNNLEIIYKDRNFGKLIKGYKRLLVIP